MLQQVLMDVSPESNKSGLGRGAGRGVGGAFSVKISVFSKSMGLMQSYKKGRVIHKVAGVVCPEESWQ